jgi:hypothetical protein
MSKLAVFLNTLLHPSSGQWMLVFIAHSSDGGGHTLIILILKQIGIHMYIIKRHFVSAFITSKLATAILQN